MKANYKVVYQGRSIQVGELFKLLEFRAVGHDAKKIATVIVQLEQTGIKVKLALIKEFDESRRLKAQFILVCTDMKRSAKKIIEAYKLRWTIAVFYRTAKQRFAFNGYPILYQNPLSCHHGIPCISLIAQLKLTHAKLKEPHLRTNHRSISQQSCPR